MNISRFWAQTLGLYLVIVSVGMMINLPQFITYSFAVTKDAPLLFVTGFFTLLLGIIMVVTHNIWRWNWRVIITITGWLSLLKGAKLTLFPQTINQLSQQVMQDGYPTYVSYFLYIPLTNEF